MDGGSTENPDINSMEDLGCLESDDNTSFIFTTIIWSLILLLSFLLNATLLLAFVKRPGLRTISNRFVMNLSASNLVTIGLLHPLLITDHAAPSAVHCTLAEGATALVTTSSIFSVLLIAIDQYLAVIDPLRYRTRIDNLKCTLLIIVVWMLSITISILAIFNTSNNINSHMSGNQQSIWQKCRSALPTDGNPSLPSVGNSSLSTDFLAIYNMAYTIVYITVIYLAPFITIIWIYLCIYTAAHNNSERTRRTGSRPVLTVTNYLTDDDYLPLRRDSDTRIKNISSLSSIDESIEITSQLQRHLSPSPIIEEDVSNVNNDNSDINTSTHVIFTVGSHSNDLTQFDTKEISRREGNSRPYTGHIGEDGGRCLEGDEQKNGDKYGKDCRGYGMPYSCHIGGVDVEKCLEDDGEVLEENGGEYGMPYSGHIGDKDVKGNSEDFREENGKQYGSGNGEYGMPYSGHMEKIDEVSEKDQDVDEIRVGYGTEDNCHIEPYGLGEHNGVENIDNEENGNYGKLPYIGHIGQNGKVYGIDEVDAYDVQKSDKEEYGKVYGSDNLPYVGHMAQNGVYGENDQDRQYGPYGRDEVDSHGSHMAQNGGLMPPKLHTRHNTRTGNYINHLRHRISNGSLFKYREETRAARISALVIVMGFVCWTPFFTIVVIKSLAVDLVYHEVDVVGVGCFLLGTIVSPMLFGYRSRRVKRELRKLFCFKRELAYKNNRSLMAKKVIKRRNSATWADNFGDKGKCYAGFWNFYRGRIKEPGKVQFVHVPETALSVDTCRSSFSSGASTQVSSTSTDDS